MYKGDSPSALLVHDPKGLYWYSSAFFDYGKELGALQLPEIGCNMVELNGRNQQIRYCVLDQLKFPWGLQRLSHLEHITVMEPRYEQGMSHCSFFAKIKDGFCAR